MMTTLMMRRNEEKKSKLSKFCESWIHKKSVSNLVSESIVAAHVLYRFESSNKRTRKCDKICSFTSPISTSLSSDPLIELITLTAKCTCAIWGHWHSIEQQSFVPSKSDEFSRKHADRRGEWELWKNRAWHSWPSTLWTREKESKMKQIYMREFRKGFHTIERESDEAGEEAHEMSLFMELTHKPDR